MSGRNVPMGERKKKVLIRLNPWKNTTYRSVRCWSFEEKKNSTGKATQIDMLLALTGNLTFSLRKQN